MIVIRSIFTPRQGKHADAVALIKEPGDGFPFPPTFRVYSCWIGANNGKIALETEHKSLADFEKWQAEVNAWSNPEFWTKWRECIKPFGPNEIWTLAN